MDEEAACSRRRSERMMKKTRRDSSEVSQHSICLDAGEVSRHSVCLDTSDHTPQCNNRPVKRLTLAATLPPAFYIVHMELWDSDAVFITQNLDIGKNVDQLDLHAHIRKIVGIPNTCTLCSYYCT